MEELVYLRRAEVENLRRKMKNRKLFRLATGLVWVREGMLFQRHFCLRVKLR